MLDTYGIVAELLLCLRMKCKSSPIKAECFLMSDELLRYRSQFPILQSTTYMISNSLGAMPRGVYDSMQNYMDMWATRGVRAWEEKWWMLSREVGDEIAAIMNAPAGSVSLHQNVTICQAVVASCLDFSRRRN